MTIATCSEEDGEIVEEGLTIFTPPISHADQHSLDQFNAEGSTAGGDA